MRPALKIIDSTSRITAETNRIDMNSTLSMILQPTAFDADQLQSLALNILKGNASGCPGLIIVANAVSPKDNGLVAGNLAVTIAEKSDRNVFLIDCDFKAPSVHKKFKLENKTGLVDYFSEKTPLYPILLNTKLDKLKVIPCGNIQNQSADHLFSDKLPGFIREWKEKCPEHVFIISTSASRISGRYSLPQNLADSIILSVDESVAGKETTKGFLKQLDTKKLAGIIKKIPSAPPVVNRQFEKTLKLVVTPENPVPVITEGKHQPGKAVNQPSEIKHEQKISASERVKPDTKKTVKEDTRHHAKLIASVNPKSFGTEQFKMVTARLVDEHEKKGAQIFMTTSFSRGDGKSFTAANIAVSVANNTDKKVILIDCDLRSPSIHTFFGKDNRSGLSNYLSQEVSFSSQCSASGIKNLTLLTAGQAGDNSFKLLSSKKMVTLLKALKKKFKDVIIILDSAPPNLIAESGVLSKLADGITLVASHRQTKKEGMKKLVDQFDKEKIIGVVYNRTGQKNSLLNYCKRLIKG